ncbi:MAG: hypothetical protein L0I62_00900 [Gammaproteobacteria bacterium]|nr:hypothetical protein [Nitrococcus sp.]MDN5863767.1 hypothetical protein [Gammaproteobacteria bacterium]
MSNKPITEAEDPDLRHSLAALRRAALRAREVAIRTGTRLIVSEQGRIRYLDPRSHDIAEPEAHYGEDE